MTMTEAITESHRLKINPGGEIEIHSMSDEPPKEQQGRLLQKVDLGLV